MAFCITDLIATLGVSNQCHYAESNICIFIAILNVNILSAVMLKVILMIIVMLSVVMLSVVMLSVVMLNVVILSVVALTTICQHLLRKLKAKPLFQKVVFCVCQS